MTVMCVSPNYVKMFSIYSQVLKFPNYFPDEQALSISLLLYHFYLNNSPPHYIYRFDFFKFTQYELGLTYQVN